MKAYALLVSTSLMIHCVAAQTAPATAAQPPPPVSVAPGAVPLVLKPISAGMVPTGIDVGQKGRAVRGELADGAILTIPRPASNDPRIQVPLFYSSELGESTAGFASGTSTSGSLGVSTTGSLGRSTTGIGGVGTYESGTDSGVISADQSPSGTISPVTLDAITSLPPGGIVSSNWLGQPIIVYVTPPPALPPGSREAFDASPWY